MPTPCTPLILALLATALLVVNATALADAASPAEATPSSDHAHTADDPQVQRVGGDPEAEVESFERNAKTMYRAGKCVVDESLPDGYPRPTPPGAIEIKHYPSVRRAEVSGNGDADFKMMGRSASNAFWPLFNHIKSRDIPMTAPVEMDYPGLSASADPEAWTMSFLYRVPDMGDTGRDGQILITDAPPVTVLSIGVRGRLNENQTRIALQTLEAWLADSPDWTPAGDTRTLGYNGPNVWPWNRWWEVQIPIRPTPQPPSNEGTANDQKRDPG